MFLDFPKKGKYQASTYTPRRHSPYSRVPDFLGCAVVNFPVLGAVTSISKYDVLGYRRMGHAYSAIWPIQVFRFRDDTRSMNLISLTTTARASELPMVASTAKKLGLAWNADRGMFSLKYTVKFTGPSSQIEKLAVAIARAS